MRKIVVYKVVQHGVGYNVFYSAFAHSLSFPIDLVCTYKLNKTTYPPIGKLLCFKTWELASVFARSLGYENAIILKGIGTNPGYPRYVSAVWQDIRSFWEQKCKHKKLSKINFTVPVGTVTVSSFTPVAVELFLNNYIKDN